jgi:type 1 fimbria pilin
MEKLGKFDGLSLEELEAQRVELLPVREEMQDLTVTFGDVAVDQVQTVAQVGSVQAFVV